MKPALIIIDILSDDFQGGRMKPEGSPEWIAAETAA